MLKDIHGVQHTLQKMHDTIERGQDTYSPHLLVLMENRIQVCMKQTEALKQYLSSISPELMPTWDKLVSILRAAAAANTRSKVGFTCNFYGNALMTLVQSIGSGKLQGRTQGD